MISASKNMQQRKRKGSTQRKVLLLLLTGLALGLTRSPNQYFRVVRAASREWQKINRDSLSRAIRSLNESKLIETKDNRDGTLTLVLSKEGKRLALTYDIENMQVKSPKKWDGRWRIVMFDIPEAHKKIRESLRMNLKNMMFYEFQKSVFVHPYPCAKEIEYIMEFYDARKYIRFIVANEIDNAIELKKHFSI